MNRELPWWDIVCWPILFLALVLAWIYPQYEDIFPYAEPRHGVIIYKACLISFGAWLGYIIDYFQSPYGRPIDYEGTDRLIAQIRRSIITFACIIGFATGL